MITLCIRSIVSLSCIRRHDRLYDSDARISRISLRATRLRRFHLTGFAYLLFPVARNSSVYRETLQNSIEILEPDSTWFGSARWWRGTNYISSTLLLAAAFVCTQYYIYVLRNVECPKPIKTVGNIYMLCFQKILKSIIRLTLVYLWLYLWKYISKIGKQNIPLFYRV